MILAALFRCVAHPSYPIGLRRSVAHMSETSSLSATLLKNAEVIYAPEPIAAKHLLIAGAHARSVLHVHDAPDRVSFPNQSLTTSGFVHPSIFFSGSALVGVLSDTERDALEGILGTEAVLDCSGCIVTPGFVDIHQHILGGGGENKAAGRN